MIEKQLNLTAADKYAEYDEICNLTKASHVFVTEKLTPYSKDYTFEMAVKPTRKATRSYTDFGVSISAPIRRIIWNMSLCDNGKKRYAELILFTKNPRKDVNEHTANIKCVYGKDFQWSYNQTYILRVEKKGKNITATVSQKGKTLAKFTAVDNSDEAFTGAFYAGSIFCRFGKPAADWGEPVKVVIPPAKLNKPKYTAGKNISKKFKEILC